MRILITGASGFIGSALARQAARAGHEVIALSRSGKAPGAAIALPWAFGLPLPEGLPSGIHCAVHLAHDFNGPAGAERTIDATLSAIGALRDKGVRRQLFYSSYSAGPHAVSLYGKTKYAIERAVEADEDVTVIRPGLVLGEGGIYGRIRKFARTFPLIPLPGGGKDELPVIDIDKLCRETLAAATAAHCPREINLFETGLRSLRQLAEDAAVEAGKKPRIVPVPAGMVMAGLQLAELLRLPLPVNSDNLKGLLANRNAAHVSSLKNEE